LIKVFQDNTDHRTQTIALGMDMPRVTTLRDHDKQDALAAI
jgi:hypothetical protein